MFILSQKIQWNSVKYCICTTFSNEKKCQYAKMNYLRKNNGVFVKWIVYSDNEILGSVCMCKIYSLICESIRNICWNVK